MERKHANATEHKKQNAIRFLSTNVQNHYKNFEIKHTLDFSFRCPIRLNAVAAAEYIMVQMN